jgi:hypothetical protein
MKILLALIPLALVSCSRQGATQTPAAPEPKPAPQVAQATPAPPPKPAPPTPESVDKLLELTGVENLNDSVIHQLGKMTENIVNHTFQGKKLGADADPLKDSARRKLQAIVKEDLSWDKMKPVYARIYSETFTQEDVDGIIAFFETKAQKDYAARMPAVTQKTYGEIQQRIGPIMKKMQDAMKDVSAQVEALNKAAASAAPQAPAAVPRPAAPPPAPSH